MERYVGVAENHRAYFREVTGTPGRPDGKWTNYFTPAQCAAADRGLISTSVLHRFDKLVRGLGGDTEELLDQVGLEISLHDHLYEQILFQDYALLLETAADTLDCDDLGMRLAAQQSGTFLTGPMRPALEGAATLGDTFLCCAAHMHIYSSAIQLHLDVYPDSHEALLVLEVLADGSPLRRQVTEQLLAKGRDDAILFSGGRARPKEVWFAHEPLASGATYQKRFGCETRFCESFDALLFNVEDLRTSVLTRDQLAYADATRTLAETFPDRTSFSAQVRREINRAIRSEGCTREAAAAALGINPRTLHRRLRLEGKTFEMIRDNVRRDLAAHYLAQSHVSLTEIAARLGFAELAVLTRACRRWFGLSPSDLRRTSIFPNFPNSETLVRQPDNRRDSALSRLA